MAAAVKAVKKENAAPKKLVEDVPADDSFDAMDDGDVPKKAAAGSTKRQATSRALKVADEGNGQSTDELERTRRERDAFARQFEELSKSRLTDVEALFERYKDKAALQAKAQADIIAGLTALNDKLATRARGLEADLVAANERAERAQQALPMDASLEGKDSRTLRQEVAKLRLVLTKREAELAQVQKEYDAEVKQSRELQKRGGGGSSSAAAAAPSSDEAEKDAESLKLYEDLVGLAVLGVDVKRGAAGKETTFACCQTVDERSLAFKLRFYNEFNHAKERWAKLVAFTPDAKALQHERDADLLARLGPFAAAFVAPRDQISALWEQMRARVSRTMTYDKIAGDV